MGPPNAVTATALDAAPLIGAFGTRQVAQIAAPAERQRAMYHRATLSLQIAAAAELAGKADLRNHALGNFVRRRDEGTLYDPGQSRPDG